MCFCGLFVSKEVMEEPSKLGPVPERRPVEAMDAAMEAKEKAEKGEEVALASGSKAIEPSQSEKDEKSLPVWRCKVCGYLCARELPPSVCPICKAKADRFESFSFG